MKRILDPYSRTIPNLLIAQQAQFHKENVEQIVPLASEVPGLGTVFGNYKKNVMNLGSEYNQRVKAEETDLMTGKDWDRDGTGNFYLSTVDFFYKHPQNEEEAAAIYPLKFLADTYRQTVKKDYKSETSAIRSLVSDTRKLTAQLALFPALTPLLNRLEAENNAFEELDLVRTLAMEAKRKRGTLGALGKKANDSFDNFVQVITGLYLMQELNTSAQTVLQKIIDILNGQIHRYTIIYHRHIGAIAAKKKGNGEDETGNRNGSDEDGDETPESGTRNPDISNPPLPPFLSDFE